MSLPKTEAERRLMVEIVLGNHRLEGLSSDPIGVTFLESYIKGDITSAKMIQLLDDCYKGSMDVKTRVA